LSAPIGGEPPALGLHGLGRPKASDAVDADLILLHPPSIYDFRERDDIFHANLSTGDSGVTAVYEMYPLGFKSIERHLATAGHSVRIINVASLMLRYPTLDVHRFLSQMSALAFGIDLHWMVHVQGSLALAEELKSLHRGIPVIFGGISSTYFSDELIQYPQVDMVMRGYDTLNPLARLISLLKSGAHEFPDVPNLVYKGSDGAVRENEFSYLPEYIPGIDWSDYRKGITTPSRNDKMKNPPYILTLTSTGCAHNCPWCGGSRDAYRRIMGKKGKTVMYKPIDELVREVESLGDVSNTGLFVYTLQWYCEPKDRILPLVRAARKVGIEKMQFELFYLTPLDTVADMCHFVKPTFNLSPQSHDLEISRLSGRGTYTMEQMEAWIEKVLPMGVQSVNVWFFIGLEKQTPRSVYETVDYCKNLLVRFKGRNVIPVINPMVPFLDPGSTIFEEPEKHGYRIFHRTVEEHRRAMLSPNPIDRLNYETDWMSRKEIVYTAFEAVKRLVIAKGEIGLIPKSFAERSAVRLDRAVEIMREIDETAFIASPDAGLRTNASVKEKVREYNRSQLSSRNDQIFPVERALDGKWFDEFEFNPTAS